MDAQTAKNQLIFSFILMGEYTQNDLRCVLNWGIFYDEIECDATALKFRNIKLIPPLFDTIKGWDFTIKHVQRTVSKTRSAAADLAIK